MTMRLVRMALSGLLLSTSACVVAPPPTPVAMAPNCRPFTQSVTVGGRTQPGSGVECQQPDGSWKIVTPATVAPPPVATGPLPGYVYQPPYYDAYPEPYPLAYPWYFGPQIGVGLGWGGGGWGGGGRGGGWHGGRGGGWHGGGGRGGHGGGGGRGGGGRGGGGRGGGRR